MKNINTLFITLLFLFSFTNITFAQSLQGCVSIDFEELPNQTPEDNLPISTQFFDDYGVTFSLENGGTPVLAAVGEPTTAFSGIAGDTPNPGQNIGTYFITDDGLWSGSTSPALLVDFATPIDSFSACVLDIDGTEEFVIEARGANGNIIQSITIKDGDPGTGNGASTCFGFNAEGCEGAIYSIRFKGTRPGGGTFGLGMDNFSFCAAETDIISQIEIETTDPTCIPNSGVVTITSQGTNNYTYALDNGAFQSNPTFTNLSSGFHNMTIQDAQGCNAFFTFFIENATPLEITNLAVTNTSCGEDNGNILVFSSTNAPLQYSLNGGSYQSANIFDNLPPGEYNIKIVDSFNCTAEQSTSINDSENLTIQALVIEHDYCNDSNGSIRITVEGGTGAIQYAINGQAPVLSSTLSNLPAGHYQITVQDAAGCRASTEDSISAGKPFFIDKLFYQGPDCEEINGSIAIHASGGNGFINYWLNDSISHAIGHFLRLSANAYRISAIDEFGCQLDTIALLPLPECTVFIPNAFTPNHDGINDNFQIFTNTFYDVEVLNFMIFNRWGDLVWSQNNFTINTFHNWWDGYFNNQAAQQDVYTYMIKVRHQTGKEELFAGDVTLVR